MNNEAVINNTGLKRYNMRFNGDLNLSKRLTATADLSFTLNEQNLRDQGTAAKTNPVFSFIGKIAFSPGKRCVGDRC
ncbi:MAG: hypothetical protein WDO16_12025 [Bacteroidota bacterium]